MQYAYRAFIKHFYKWSLILGLLWVNNYALSSASSENQHPNPRIAQNTSISEQYFQKFRPEILQRYQAYIQSNDNGESSFWYYFASRLSIMTLIKNLLKISLIIVIP